MKKVIILVIVLIYLASIFVVNFFGLEIVVFDGTVYVEEIQIDRITMFDLTGVGNDRVIYQDEADLLTIGGEKYNLYVFPYTPPKEGETYTRDNIGDNPNQVLIDVQVMPLDADHKGVSFLYDEKDETDGNVVFLEDTRTVVFLKPDMIIGLTIKAVDGSNVQTKRFYLKASSSARS